MAYDDAKTPSAPQTQISSMMSSLEESIAILAKHVGELDQQFLPALERKLHRVALISDGSPEVAQSEAKNEAAPRAVFVPMADDLDSMRSQVQSQIRRVRGICERMEYITGRIEL